MNAITTTEGNDALNPMQRAFVDQLVKGTEPDEAKKLAGYSDSVKASHILASPRVQAAIRAGCAAELAGPMRVDALNALRELLKPGNPAATRFNAAKLVIEHGDDQPGIGDKPLTELSIPELEALIARQEAALKDVTPSNGA